MGSDAKRLMAAAEKLLKQGKVDEARVAYRSGIEAARHHGHPTMVEEFEEILQSWDL